MENRSKYSGSRVQEVKKPFLTGSTLDENTLKNSAKFFGLYIMITFVSFIACSSSTFGGDILRFVLNILIIGVILMLFFNFGSGKGAEAVSRGEILYQKQEKGQFISVGEKKICFHKLKGFAISLIGMIPMLIPAIMLAFCTTLQTTDSGTLPSWMQSYIRRSDIGNALVNYTQPVGMQFTDYLRAFVRICLLPFVNLIGYTNKTGLLIMERLSPVLLLLPAAAYGIGYLSGRSIRTRIHTTISENDKKRIRREKKRQKIRSRTVQHREPEQLN